MEDCNILLNEYEKLTKEHYKIFGLSWAGWIFDFYDLMLFSFLIMPIGADLGLSHITFSYIMGSTLLATAIGGIIFGGLADKYGRKRVLQWTIIIYSVGALLCAFSFNATSLLIFRVITGLGVGGEWATGQTYIGETFPSKLRNRYGSLMQTGAPLGVMLAAIVGGFLAPTIGWRLSFLISVLPAILVIFIRHNLQESDLWLQNKKKGKGKSVLNKVKKLVSKEHRKIFLLCLILCIFGMTAYWFTYTWLPEYLSKERGLAITKSAIGIIIIQLGGFLGYFSFGYVSDKIGRRPAFTLYSIIMAISVSMITIFWNAIVDIPRIILIFLFLVGFGTGYFGGFGPLFSEQFPTKIRSTGLGTIFNISRGVQFVTPVAIAMISATYQMSAGIFLAAVFAILGGIWIWTLPETQGSELTE